MPRYGTHYSEICTKIKSMSASKFNRYVWLLDLVARHNGITYKNISHAWSRSSLNDLRGTPLPRRTFNNHIAAIKEMFDINIVCLRQGGYKYVLQGADGGALSETQLQLLRQLRLSNAVATNPALNKRIVLDKSIVYRHLNPLLEVMEESRSIKLMFRRQEEGRVVRIEYIFEPYFIKQFKSDWFVIGRSVEENILRIFCFRHFGPIEPLDMTFSYPEEFCIDKFMDEIAESNACENSPTDDRDLFIALRLDDKRMHRSVYGSFIPEEVVR